MAPVTEWPGTLFHFTCQHGRDGIGEAGLCKPLALWNPAAASRLGDRWELGVLAWFTDLDTPVAAALGLTRVTISCDRTVFRYRVTDPGNVERWVGSQWRRRSVWLRDLEREAGSMPMHWYVAAEPVPVVFDPLR